MYFCSHWPKLPSSPGNIEKAITNIPKMLNIIKKKVLIIFSIIKHIDARKLKN